MADTFRIVIDVRADGDEISGEAGLEGGGHQPFLGWLGLIGALDALVRAPRPHDEHPAVRVCVAFASGEDARSFAASARLHEAIAAIGCETAPEIWFTRTQSGGEA
jgi:hypothetical protein